MVQRLDQSEAPVSAIGMERRFALNSQPQLVKIDQSMCVQYSRRALDGHFCSQCSETSKPNE